MNHNYNIKDSKLILTLIKDYFNPANVMFSIDGINAISSQTALRKLDYQNKYTLYFDYGHSNTNTLINYSTSNRIINQIYSRGINRGIKHTIDE